jgi:hypothetical protein
VISKIFLIAVFILFIYSTAYANHDESIVGPDTDGNGIRDDIDAYIATLPYTEVQ